MEYVPDQFKTSEMCDKVIDRCFLVFDSILDQCKTQVIRDRVVSEDPFLIVYCRDRYKTQRMCDEAVDDSLASLKFLPDWFVTSKMIKNFYCFTRNLIYFNENSGDVIFS